MRLAFFEISPIIINILIVFKAVPQVYQFFSCVGKCWTKVEGLPKDFDFLNMPKNKFQCL